MTSEIFNAADIDLNTQFSCQVEEPEECPLCHFAIKPIRMQAHIRTKSVFDPELYCVYLCAHCHSPFFCHYLGYLSNHSYGTDYIFSHLHEVAPKSISVSDFSPEISALSPSFVDTYHQSEIAEQNNLLQICGTGYRKSLEFLVKDYLCHKFPDDTDAICSEFLSSSIKRIDDARIKTLAERATWIGNDETHYIKNREDLSLDDMKKFITAMLRYIESELAFEAAESISRI